MSQVTKPILTDDTGLLIKSSIENQNEILSELNLNDVALQIHQSLEKQNEILSAMSISDSSNALSSYEDIARIVRNGYAEKVFNIGDQIYTDWTDIATNTTYQVPMDIVHFGDIVTESGETKHGMFLQWHYCTPFGIQFDAAEAFYCAETEELPAGTYNITMGEKWGNNVIANKTYQFTLTNPVPVGGQLVGFYGAPDQAVSNWTVSSFSSNSTKTAIETASVAEGNEGANLGTLTSKATDGLLNSLHCTAYGYNRWAYSAIRQYLNSSLGVNSWWQPQHKYDRPPNELATKAGFMSGFSEDFLHVIKPIQVKTAKNTCNDNGEFETTYDRFFLPSLEEEYITPQITGEGDTWEYWKEISKRTSPIPQYVTGAAPITYALNATTSPQHVRLRSAYRGYACDAWGVYSSGRVSNSNATISWRFAPACVIY